MLIPFLITCLPITISIFKALHPSCSLTAWFDIDPNRMCELTRIEKFLETVLKHKEMKTTVSPICGSDFPLAKQPFAFGWSPLSDTLRSSCLCVPVLSPFFSSFLQIPFSFGSSLSPSFFFLCLLLSVVSSKIKYRVTQ